MSDNASYVQSRCRRLFRNVIVPPVRNDTNWMGLVTMSERDLKRIEVLTEVLAGRRTVVSAAAVLALGVRQTFLLLARYQEGGGGALIHQARGRTSNNRLISWHPRVCDRTASVALCRFRPKPGAEGSVPEGRSQGLARDAAQVD